MSTEDPVRARSDAQRALTEPGEPAMGAAPGDASTVSGAPHSVEELQRRVATGQRRAALLKLSVLAAMAVGMLLLFKLTPLGGWLSEENLQSLLTAAGPWARVVFVFVYAVLIALWIPGTVMTLAGAAIFGPVGAIPLNYLGAILGAGLGFGTARRVGGDALETLIGDKWSAGQRYRELMGSRGFEAMLYLRLIPTPYNAISYLAGLSTMSFRSFISGTSLGIIPGSIAFTYLLGILAEALGGDWGVLLTWRAMLAVSLYGAALSIPFFVNQGRKRFGWFASVDTVEPGA